MIKVEGIIYKAFGNYIVLRGYAKISDLAKISKRPPAYQRTADEKHKRDIIEFLSEGKYTYFPELILAFRTPEFGSLNSLIVSTTSDIKQENTEDIIGNLRILKEKVPTTGYRARHAHLSIEESTEEQKLVRIDGNHRLEPFDSDYAWWWEFVKEDEPESYTDEQLVQWKKNLVRPFRENIEKKTVPFSIVISDGLNADAFEAGIFNNINFKQLPLKQEKNLQNIHHFLKDTDELGEPHKLTMVLIDLAESHHFKGLAHLTPIGNDDDVYRTACLKIANILLEKKREISKANKIDELKQEIDILSKNIEENTPIVEELLKNKKKERGKKNKNESQLRQLEEIANNALKELEKNKRSEIKRKNQLDKTTSYLNAIENKDKIEIAIQSLRSTYAKMENNSKGNLSMLAALVYYKLLDESKFNSFVEWIMRNGIHKIPISDYLPSHNANSLISLFERIYEAKAKEVFISMQFGDPQSEMIFEKVVQTIERFNTVKGLDISITPVRIDQSVRAHAFSIPDEILRAIDNSSLIIADLSSSNNNVYHEIGYAMGIAKANGIEPPIILLYKNDTVFKREETDGDKFVGFNLRGTSQLRFTTYKELMDQLTRRLEIQFEV